MVEKGGRKKYITERNGRIVGGEGWQEKIHNREECKKLLRTARNRRILHMPMEWMNKSVYDFIFRGHSVLQIRSSDLLRVKTLRDTKRIQSSGHKSLTPRYRDPTT